MSLIEFIQKLQDKPRYVRLRILWLSVFIFMIIIVSLWIISFKDSLLDKAEEKKSDELVQSLNNVKEQMPSLINSFKASIGSFFEEDIEIVPASTEIKVEEELKKIIPGKLPLSKNIND